MHDIQGLAAPSQPPVSTAAGYVEWWTMPVRFRHVPVHLATEVTHVTIKPVDAARPHFELRQVLGDGTETIEICSLTQLSGRAQAVHLDRRGFVGLSTFAASAALLLAGCASPARRASATPRPTAGPIATKAVPTAAPVAGGCDSLWAHNGSIYALAFSPDGALLASGGSDNRVKLWEVAGGSLVRELEGHTSDAYSVAFSPDGTLLASGSGDNSIKLWRVDTGQVVREFEGNTSDVYSVAFSPDGTLLASGSANGMVGLWRVADGSLVGELLGPTDGAYCVAFSPDGALVASGGSDENVRLCRVADGSLVRELEGPTGGVKCVAFSPDGKLLASAGSDKDVRLCRVADGSLMRKLTGHRGTVNDVAFSPDGKLLASSSGDGVVRMWRVVDGVAVYQTRGHQSTAHCVAFSPDGTLVASSGQDGTIRLWVTADSRARPVACFFDPTATPADQEANTYQVTDASGVTRTYVLPCGSPIPAGAVCTCNCIPGTYQVPTRVPTARPTTPSRPRSGGTICTCNKVCTCIPVRKYCFVMFK